MQSSPRFNKAQGFTLVEVLVAALILFMVITTMMTIYRGAMLTSIKAEGSLDFSTQIIQLKTTITEAIRNHRSLSELAASGTIADIDYNWVAQAHASGVASHPDNLPITEIIATQSNHPSGSTPVHLWRVSVELKRNNRVREYEFWEISW